jgi:catechol 2,3-dioxygenase-like lactoylglutathione lyase family enzyme
MSKSEAAIRIYEVGTLFVPVTDQERALAFYVNQLGFEKRVDFIYGGGSRWIEVAPIGATNTISLVPPTEGTSSRSDSALCAFATHDIRADHSRLLDAGVDVDAEIAGAGSSRTGLISDGATITDPVPSQFFLRDPDGNRFLVVGAG